MTAREAWRGLGMSELGDPGAIQRPEDDDHDLLTFGEAGARLGTEIRAMRARVTELESAATADEPTLAAARARLVALEDGARRNSAQPINDENFERFFGYPGRARRSPG
jgi:hypothetical protein